MESDIYIKATNSEMGNFFADPGFNVCVRLCEELGPGIFKVRVRHREMDKQLHGTFTIDELRDALADESSRQDEIYLGYVAFTLGYDLLQNILMESKMNHEEAYEYCYKLAKQYVHSEYDDECEPTYDCITCFV